jgi:pimeloyl-ACP methyl ester carboxylesterase
MLPTARETAMTTFVLVAGAWHGAWCWYKVAPLLEEAGHAVVAVDLPSLGRDTTPISAVSLQMWRDHVVDIVDAQPDRVVLVGHSRGGVVISAVAEQRPHRIEALVYVAAFLLGDGESCNDQAAYDDTVLTRNIQSSDGGTALVVADEAIRAAFYGECSEADVAHARACLRPEAAVVLGTPVSISDARFGRVPRDYVECLRDNALSLASQRRMQAAQPCRRTLALDTDHSPFFSAPDQLVEFLVGAAADLAPVGEVGSK